MAKLKQIDSAVKAKVGMRSLAAIVERECEGVDEATTTSRSGLLSDKLLTAVL